MVDKDWLADRIEDAGKPADGKKAAEFGATEHWENAGEGQDVGNVGERQNAGNAEGRYRSLPEPIHVEDMVATKDTRPVPDPKMGRDTETDFMLRNAGGFG